MTTLNINTARAFLPLLNDDVRYLGAHGGRGSGKSHFFAERLIERAIMKPTRWVCLREIQKSIRQSVKLLLEDKIKIMGVSSLFRVMEDRIECPHGGLITFSGLQNHTADSIKSLEGYDGAWLTEAQTISQRSLDLLRPTIRKEGSQIWADWNPENDEIPIDKLLRGEGRVTNSIVIEVNYKDNPFFPETLRKEMEEDRARDYDKYLHVWEGQYRRTLDGAVYANEIRAAYESKRVTKVLPIAGKPIETFWDLGKRDHTAIWFAQLTMGEYRILDFYQNRGQNLPHYFEVIRERGYQLGTIWLPHDAEQDRLTGSIDKIFRAHYPNNKVWVIQRMAKKNIGIEAVRRIFPTCYFDEEKTKLGMRALSRFKYDVDPDTGHYSKQPLHDEYSDAADAFAQLALSMVEAAKPQQQTHSPRPSFWAQ